MTLTLTRARTYTRTLTRARTYTRTRTQLDTIFVTVVYYKHLCHCELSALCAAPEQLQLKFLIPIHQSQNRAKPVHWHWQLKLLPVTVEQLWMMVCHGKPVQCEVECFLKLRFSSLLRALQASLCAPTWTGLPVGVWPMLSQRSTCANCSMVWFTCTTRRWFTGT